MDTFVCKLQAGVDLFQCLDYVARGWRGLYDVCIHILLHGVNRNVLYRKLYLNHPYLQINWETCEKCGY